MEIIPAIDIIEGKCVRLTQGDYNQKKEYTQSPLEAAKMFEDVGITRLHLVDLDGAKAGKVINLKVLETIASHTHLKIDFGGGVKTENDVQSVIDAGAFLVTVGSIAAKNEDLFLAWVNKYGANRFFLGADVKNGKIAISGWQEESKWSVLDFIDNYVSKEITNIFCTDVSKDGLLQGPALDLYEKIILHNAKVNLVASGGVAGIDDLKKLKEIRCAGVIIGKAIYEGRITINELKSFNK